MASGLKSRILYREHSASANGWAGTWNMLIRPKTLPSPMGERNQIDVSTLEDEQEVTEPGRRASVTMSVQGAMEKEYLDDIDELADTKLDFLVLYGTEGLGSIAKYGFSGYADVAPDEADADEHLTMTVSIAVSTVPEKITDSITVTTADNKTFTVAAAG